MKFFKNPINRRWLAAFFLTAAVSAVWARAGLADQPPQPAVPAAAARTYQVAEVLSGDTFRLQSGTVVAYASIAAPPVVHKDPAVREYAQKSKEFNRSLIEGHTVRIEFGSRIKNGDGIYEGFVFLEDGSFANLKMIEAGFAKLKIVPPNLQYAEELRRASTHARRDGSGLWEYENKKDHRFTFVGDKMTHKFHFEGCEALRGIPTAHLTYFDSSVSAKAAGYEFCKVCRNLYAQKTDLF